MTLTDWLLEQIADDEAVARDAAGWESNGRAADVRGLVVYGDGPAPNNAAAEHIARFDPARVLAECASKRAIVALHTPDHECTDGSEQYPGVFAGLPGWTTCDTLRLLAEPYADRPGYDGAVA